MGRQLFGTDGIRGVAGEYPLDRRTVHAVGIALGHWAVGLHGPDSTILIGMDTRESGAWIAATLSAGAAKSGAKVRFAGLITTPGVAYLTRTRDFVAGVMISASHNPYHDNGIKVFGHSGYKLPDEEEHQLEREIFALLAVGLEPTEAPLNIDPGLDRGYLDYLASTFSHRLENRRLVLDCANGAAAELAPELFRSLGAEVIAIGCQPDGRNINLACGALHVDNLRQKVLESGADAGVAFDGDADRAIFVSSSGRIVDGDGVMLLIADALIASNGLSGADGQPVMVATAMSNLGLEVVLRHWGVKLVRAAVGDKYVLEEMIRLGAPVGGEQSGHVIFHRYATTGDGMLTALRVLDVMCERASTLDDLVREWKVFPQTLVNVRIREKRPIEELASVQREIDKAVRHFDGAGRVLVRFSGTEPLARIMVEGPDVSHVETFARRIAQAVQAELGAV